MEVNHFFTKILQINSSLSFINEYGPTTKLLGEFSECPVWPKKRTTNNNILNHINSNNNPPQGIKEFLCDIVDAIWVFKGEIVAVVLF